MKAKWGRLLQYGFVSWSLSRSPLLSSLSWLRPSHWTNFLLCYCSFQLVVTNWDMGYSELVGNVCQKLNLFLRLIVGLLPTFWSCQLVETPLRSRHRNSKKSVDFEKATDFVMVVAHQKTPCHKNGPSKIYSPLVLDVRMSILDENKKRETKEIYHSSRGRWRSASQVDQL